MECAAIQDVLVVGKAPDEAASQQRKTELERMAAMLSRLGGRGCQVRESKQAYAAGGEEVDPDSNLDETQPRQRGEGDGIPPPHR